MVGPPMAAADPQPRFGALLRQWRERRRQTQMDLALDAGVSTRHLSFIETGRSQPSTEMVLLLAERLGVPIRGRNELLLAAGYAPVFPERRFGDPELAAVREALDLILSGQEPSPAVVVDRRWNIVAANRAMAALVANVDPKLLEPPLNAMRIGLHPDGFIREVLNPGDVQAYFIGRLERQVALSADDELVGLLDEVHSYPRHEQEHDPASLPAAGEILTPLFRMRGPDGDELQLFATVATFGTAVEVTTSELSIELTFPADAATAEALRRLPRR
jgi:transcriptional regulator with XRE-family HTH domain